MKTIKYFGIVLGAIMILFMNYSIAQTSEKKDIKTDESKIKKATIIKEEDSNVDKKIEVKEDESVVEKKLEKEEPKDSVKKVIRKKVIRVNKLDGTKRKTKIIRKTDRPFQRGIKIDKPSGAKKSIEESEQ